MSEEQNDERQPAHQPTRRGMLKWLPVLGGAGLGAAALLRTRDAHAFLATPSTTGSRVFGTFDVTDYGAVPNVSDSTQQTNNVTAIKNAFSAAVSAKGGTVYFPPGEYFVNSEVNLSGNSVVLQGASAGGSFITASSAVRSIICLQGCIAITIRDLGLNSSNPAARAKTGLLLARSSSASSGEHVFERIAIFGYYSCAGVYSIASEGNVFRDSLISMDHPREADPPHDFISDPGPRNYAFFTSTGDSYTPALGATADMPAPAASTNLSGWISGCTLRNDSGNADSAVMYFEGTSGTAAWTVRDSGLSSRCGYGVVITSDRGSGGMHGPMVFDSLYAETSGPAGFYLQEIGTGADVVSLSHLSITNCHFSQSGTYFIRATDNLLLNYSNLNNNSSFGSGSLAHLDSSVILETGISYTCRGSCTSSIIFQGHGRTFTAPTGDRNVINDSRGVITGRTGNRAIREILSYTYTFTLPSLAPGASTIVADTSVNSPWGSVDTIMATCTDGPGLLIQATVGNYTTLHFTILNTYTATVGPGTIHVNVIAFRHEY